MTEQLTLSQRLRMHAAILPDDSKVFVEMSRDQLNTLARMLERVDHMETASRASIAMREQRISQIIEASTPLAWSLTCIALLGVMV